MSSKTSGQAQERFKQRGWGRGTDRTVPQGAFAARASPCSGLTTPARRVSLPSHLPFSSHCQSTGSQEREKEETGIHSACQNQGQTTNISQAGCQAWQPLLPAPALAPEHRSCPAAPRDEHPSAPHCSSSGIRAQTKPPPAGTSLSPLLLQRKEARELLEHSPYGWSGNPKLLLT